MSTGRWMRKARFLRVRKRVTTSNKSKVFHKKHSGQALNGSRNGKKH
jgi:hypothetical protein